MPIAPFRSASNWIGRPMLPLAAVAALVGCATNEAPITPQITLGPDGATSLDDLVVELAGEATDEDGDAVSLSFTWSVDGQYRADLDGSRSVPSRLTRKGQEWSVLVSTSDGVAEGSRQASSLVVQNAAPVAVLTQVPFAPDSDQNFAVEIDTFDADDDSVIIIWSWTVDGADAGIARPNVPASSTTRGEVWEVTAIPTDGETPGEPVKAIVDVANRRPTVQAVTLAPTQAFEATTLTASGIAFDPDEDDTELFWTWFVNGVEVKSGNEQTLTGEDFDRGDAVAVVAVATDGFVLGEPVASDPLEIQNSPPLIDTVSIDQSEVAEGTDVSCSYSGFFDADGDEDEVRLSWEVEGRPAFEGAILTSDYFDRGQQIVCVATPHDGIEDGRALRSAPVRVLNSLPEIASITLDNLSPAEGDSITATVNGAADADGDAIHLVYAWSVDGTVVSTDPVLTSTSFNKGDTIELSITPNDGLDDGVAVVSPTATAVNTAPVVHTVTLAPTSPDTDDVLTATVDATDADSDALSFTYEWTVGGSVVGGESGATLSGDVFAKNEVVSVSVVANDGDTDSATVSAASVTVINSPPAFTAVAVDPTTAFEDTVLTCTPSGWSDLDEDAENYDYDWSVNGTSVSTSETLNGSLFNKGDQVVCSATANDLDDTGNTLSSAAVTIDNSLPTLANVRLSDLTPLPGDTLTATAGATTDADGDSVTIEYAWTLDGVDAGTGPTLDLTGATKDAVAVVTATPFDDDGGGTAVTASATIGNTAPTLTSVSLSPSSPGTDEAITATAVSNDFDGDTLTTTYAWTVNSTAVSGATSDTLAASHFAKDDVVQVTVTVDDGDDTTDQTASVTVGNTAPTAPSVSIASVDVEDDEDLICSISTASTDADADSLSYTISWTVDGVNYTGTTLTTTLSGDTIDASATSPNETWACAVVANDGTDDGPEATATADVTYCSIVLTASDSVSVDYDAGTVDDSDEVTIGLDTGYDAVGWYQFDLSSIDDTATIRSAVLSAYETGGGALGSPTVEVAVSDDDGWVPSTLTYGNLEVDGTVSDGGLSSITTAAANEFELDVSAWSYSGDLTDDEVSLGLFSDTSGSLAAFAGPDASGQEPTLTMTLESCD